MEVVVTASDGTRAASTEDAFVSVYDLHSDAHIQTFKSTATQAGGTLLSGGHVLAAQRDKPLLHVYRWNKEAVDQRIVLPELVTCLAASPEVQPAHAASSSGAASAGGGYLLAGTQSGRLYLWNTRSVAGEMVLARDAHYGAVTSLAWSSCGRYFATAGRDAKCKVWRLVDVFDREAAVTGAQEVNKSIHDLGEHTRTITAVVIGKGPGERARLYTASEDGTLRVYELRTGELLTTFVLSGGAATSIAVDAADRHAFVGMASGAIVQVAFYRRDAVDGLHAVGGRGEIVTATTETGSGGGDTGDVEMDDEDDEAGDAGAQGTHTLRGHEAAITAIGLNLDGSRLVSGDANGQVFVWDVAARQVVRRLRQQSGSVTLAHVVQINNATGPQVNVGSGTMDSIRSTGQSSKAQGQMRLPMLKRSLWRPEQELVSVQMRLVDAEDVEAEFDGMPISRDAEQSSVAIRRELDEWTQPTQTLVGAAGDGAGARATTDAEDGAPDEAEQAQQTITKLRAELVKVYGHYKDLQAKYDKLESDYVSSQL